MLSALSGLATGRVDEAIHRYTNAIEMNGRIGAWPFLALSRLGLARALVAKGNLEDLAAARTLVIAAAAEFRRLDLPGSLAAGLQPPPTRHILTCSWTDEE